MRDDFFEFLFSTSDSHHWSEVTRTPFSSRARGVACLFRSTIPFLLKSKFEMATLAWREPDTAVPWIWPAHYDKISAGFSRAAPHADLKTENVMMADHIRQPLRVKTINFGLACTVSTPWHAEVQRSTPSGTDDSLTAHFVSERTSNSRGNVHWHQVFTEPHVSRLAVMFWP